MTAEPDLTARHTVIICTSCLSQDIFVFALVGVSVNGFTGTEEYALAPKVHP